MKIQNKRILSFMLAMLFVLSLVPACLAASASDIDGALEPGVPYEVATPDEVLLTFTPEEDGYYVFSSAQGEMYVDTYAYLFASQEDYNNWDYIAQDDDGGDNNSFYFVCDLEKDNEYILSVRHYDEFEDIYYTVSVEKALAPESIAIEYDEYSMYNNESHSIYVYFDNYDAYGNMEWTVSDPSVLNIDYVRNYAGGGRVDVTALKAGTVTLTATCGELSDSAIVVVEERPALEGIDITASNFETFIDEWRYVYVDFLPENAIGEAEWSIDDETVVKIEDFGTSYAEIHTLKAGTATLTATCGEFSDSITITVIPPINANDDIGKVVLSNYEDKTMLQYDVEEDGWYSLDFNCDGYAYVRFADENASYVSEYVTGEDSFAFELTAGTYYAYLYSDSDDGCVIDISLNKANAPEAITESGFLKDSMTVSYLDRFVVEWELTEEDSYNCDIYFSISDSNVIYEYSDNRIYDATGIGTATLTMYKYDYDSGEETALDTIEITVTDAPEVELDSITELCIEANTRKAYKFVVPVGGDYVFWSSAESDMDPKIYVYDADGNILGSSDDAMGMNFVYNAYMEEGDIYYLQLNGYDDPTEFKLHINEQGIKVSDVELYVKEWYYVNRDGDTYYFILDKDEETWINVDFIYNVPLDYNVEYDVDLKSDDKNIADPEYVTSDYAEVLLDKVGKTKLTFTYSDANGTEIEKSITVVVINDTEFDPNFDSKFDAFDVGFMLDVISGEKQANLEQYKKMNANGDKLVNADDIDEAITLLAIDESDKTAPVIEGIKNGQTYNADAAFTVKGQDIASVTINGKALDVVLSSDAKEGYVLSAEGVLKLNKTATEYTVVATDMNGNKTTVKVTVEPKSEDVTPPDGENPDKETPETKLGDINGNDKIDMTDYILLKRAYFGTFKFNDKQNEAGDINKNDKIDMTDYILLKRVYFGTYTIK